MSWIAELERAGSEYGVGPAAQRKLVAFVELFLRWNQKINLSSARTPSDVTHHVIDCMALLPHLPTLGRLADVGSGGGLPGCIIAIAMDNIAVASFEPIHKKTAFQSTAARSIPFSIDIQARRLDPAVDTNFDVAVSRATFDLGDWLALGAQVIRPGGVVLAMEGREIHRLPTGATRHPYAHGDRTRSIIAYRPAASST